MDKPVMRQNEKVAATHIADFHPKITRSRYGALSAPHLSPPRVKRSVYPSYNILVPSIHSSTLLPAPAESMDEFHSSYVAVDSQYLERDYYGAEHAEQDDVGGRLPNGHFNAALEILLQVLFPLIGNQSRPPGEIGGHLRGDKVWCSGDRFGVHKAEGN